MKNFLKVFAFVLVFSSSVTILNASELRQSSTGDWTSNYVRNLDGLTNVGTHENYSGTKYVKLAIYGQSEGAWVTQGRYAMTSGQQVNRTYNGHYNWNYKGKTDIEGSYTHYPWYNG